MLYIKLKKIKIKIKIKKKKKNIDKFDQKAHNIIRTPK